MKIFLIHWSTFFFDQNVTWQWAHVSGLFFHAYSENQVSFALAHLVFLVYITPFDWKKSKIDQKFLYHHIGLGHNIISEILKTYDYVAVTCYEIKRIQTT